MLLESWEDKEEVEKRKHLLQRHISEVDQLYQRPELPIRQQGWDVHLAKLGLDSVDAALSIAPILPVKSARPMGAKKSWSIATRLPNAFRLTLPIAPAAPAAAPAAPAALLKGNLNSRNLFHSANKGAYQHQTLESVLT